MSNTLNTLIKTLLKVLEYGILLKHYNDMTTIMLSGSRNAFWKTLEMTENDNRAHVLAYSQRRPSRTKLSSVTYKSHSFFTGNVL